MIYDNVQLRISPTDIVYITGESGSGKSVLLRELECDLKGDSINIERITETTNKPIIDTIGKTLDEGLELLSRVGLNDAFLFIRRFNELSDGQKYRYKLAKLIESGKQYWVMDEFSATLDRDMAKIVAFNVQKQARKTGKAVLAATTHTDLFEDLAPSVHVHKGWGKRIEVKYNSNEINETCSVTKGLRIQEGTLTDWRELEPWHYREGKPPQIMKIYALKRNDETIGVIIYSHPGVLASGRYKAFGRRVPIEELNRNFASISRVVLHPKYRSIGLGVKLVKETLPLINKPFVEAIAVMARYNPFFEKAGMAKIMETKPDKTILIAVEKLRKLGFNPIFMGSEKHNFALLSKTDINRIRNVLLEISSGYYKRLKATHKAYIKKDEWQAFLENATIEQLAKVLRRLAILTQTKVYLLWKNPAYLDHMRGWGS